MIGQKHLGTDIEAELASERNVFKKILFIYLTETTQAVLADEGEAGPPLSREPNSGLDLRTLR